MKMSVSLQKLFIPLMMGSVLLIAQLQARAEDGSPANFTPPTVHHLSESDLKTITTDSGSFGDHIYINKPHLEVGLSHLGKGKPSPPWVYYYEEAFYIMKGRGRLTVSVLPHTKTQTLDVEAGDLLYFGIGDKVTFQATSDEGITVLYVTTPNAGL